MNDWLSTSHPTESVDGFETGNTTSLIGPPHDAELLAFREALLRRIDCLETIEAKMAELEAQRDKLRKEVAALNSLLGCDTDKPLSVSVSDIASGVQHKTTDLFGPNLDNGNVGESRRSPALVESVDATVEVLRQNGRPLHYRQIYAEVTNMGVYVTGKDPAATLLARFSRDPRIERVSSGTYRLIPDMAYIED